MNEQFAIAIHGGAGTLHRERFSQSVVQQYEKALRQALQAGLHILQNGGRSLDAVETAVMELEDCPFFNAGRGAVFNADGGHTLDAAIMDGSTLAAGAVAALSGFKSPIQVARAVMERTRYVLLSGQGAAEFAREQGMEEATADYFYTDLRYHQWKKKQENERDQSADLNFGTVGAVALDKEGNLAAATSTGGLTNKQYGRVGDSPIIGCGTYANNNTCAVSCTGDGEHFIRAVAAYDISCLIEYKLLTLPEACAYSIQRLEKINGRGGLIAIDRWGNIQMPYNSEGMYRACCNVNGEITIRIFE